MIMSPFLLEKSQICSKTFFYQFSKFHCKEIVCDFLRNDESNFWKANEADPFPELPAQVAPAW